MEFLEKQLTAVQESLRVSPENVPLRRMLAETLLALNRVDEAEAEARRALQYNPKDTGCKMLLAQMCLQQGKLSVGLVLIEDVLAGDDTLAEAWHINAQLLARSGNLAEAHDSWGRARALDASLSDADLEQRLEEAPRSSAQNEPDKSTPRPARAALSSSGDFDFLDGLADQHPADGEYIEEPVRPSFLIEKPPFGFEGVGGMESVKDDVRMKIILPAANQDLYAMYGKKAGGGILLYGPPGCGKTHLARATAGEIDAKFISIGLHDILDMYVGNSEKQLHQVFEFARANTPCVLFFDEVDALAASRSDMRNSAGRFTINQFLAEFDGMNASNEGVLILAATNAPWHLDNAFRRPGRFDQVIFVPPPDADARAEILKLQLQNKPVDKVDYKKVAAKTKEFSGADLSGLIERVIEDKLRQAMKTGKPEPISTKDLLASLKRQKPSTQEWLATARNYVSFANEGGIYDDVKDYLNLR